MLDAWSEVERITAVERGTEPSLFAEVECVTTFFAEAEKREHQCADHGSKDTRQEQCSGPSTDQTLRLVEPEYKCGHDAAREQHRRRERLGTDPQRPLSFDLLTTLSSMVMRRFFDFASRMTFCSAGLSSPSNAGTS